MGRSEVAGGEETETYSREGATYAQALWHQVHRKTEPRCRGQERGGGSMEWRGGIHTIKAALTLSQNFLCHENSGRSGKGPQLGEQVSGTPSYLHVEKIAQVVMEPVCLYETCPTSFTGVQCVQKLEKALIKCSQQFFKHM